MKLKLIWFIIVIACVSRLYHINFPVAGFQSWRQADTASMARNFYENGFNLFYPQIDWRGNTSGSVETEFPLYPFLVALLYKVFSPDDMWGRILSVLCSLVTVLFLYLLVRKILGEKVALYASLFYAIAPVNIYYTRAFMPESMMLMSSVVGVYLFTEWLDNQTPLDFLLSAVFVALAALLKIPALYLGMPLFFLAWCKYHSEVLKKPSLWLFALLVAGPVALWYSHAHEIYRNTGLSFGIWFFGKDKWGIAGPLFTLKFYNDVFFKSIAERHLTYAGFVLLVIGLFIKRESLRERVFDWWCVALLVFVALVTIGNQVHEYYQLPFMVPASVFVGKALKKYLPDLKSRVGWQHSKIFRVTLFLCVVGMPVLSFLRVSNYMKGERMDSALFRLAKAVQTRTEPTRLMVTVDEGNPVVLYRCNRKGWQSYPESLTAEFLNDKNKNGAQYLAGEKELFDTPERQTILKRVLTSYEVVYDTTDCFITKLCQK